MPNNMVMSLVNVFEIKAKLSEYLDRAVRGERVIICRHNKPVAELRALEPVQTQPRPIGPLAGRPTFELAPSFFEPLSDDELDAWEGPVSVDPLQGSWPPYAPPSGQSRVAEKAPDLPKPSTRSPRGRS